MTMWMIWNPNKQKHQHTTNILLQAGISYCHSSGTFSDQKAASLKFPLPGHRQVKGGGSHSDESCRQRQKCRGETEISGDQGRRAVGPLAWAEILGLPIDLAGSFLARWWAQQILLTHSGQDIHNPWVHPFLPCFLLFPPSVLTLPSLPHSLTPPALLQPSSLFHLVLSLPSSFIDSFHLPPPSSTSSSSFSFLSFAVVHRFPQKVTLHSCPDFYYRICPQSYSNSIETNYITDR